MNVDLTGSAKDLRSTGLIPGLIHVLAWLEVCLGPKETFRVDNPVKSGMQYIRVTVVYTKSSSSRISAGCLIPMPVGLYNNLRIQDYVQGYLNDMRKKLNDAIKELV